jgi:hypothetical protein
LSTTAAPKAPSLHIDLYSRATLLDPIATYRLIRQAGDVVWLPKHQLWVHALLEAMMSRVTQIGVSKTGAAAQQHLAGFPVAAGHLSPFHRGLTARRMRPHPPAL